MGAKMTDALAAAYEKVLAERNELQVQVNGLHLMLKTNNKIIDHLREKLNAQRHQQEAA